jgi:hypothetical protein
MLSAAPVYVFMLLRVFQVVLYFYGIPKNLNVGFQSLQML